MIHDKQNLIDNLNDKVAEISKRVEAVDRISNINKDLVVRKCALEAQNKQKEYQLIEARGKCELLESAVESLKKG